MLKSLPWEEDLVGTTCTYIEDSFPLPRLLSLGLPSPDCLIIISCFIQPLTMSFTSPIEQFKAYQAFSSGSPSSKQPAQSFSSRVDFRDQSYDIPYFKGSDASVVNPQTNYASTASKQPVTDVSRGFTPKQLADATKTKSFDKKRFSSIPNTSQQCTYAIYVNCALC